MNFLHFFVNPLRFGIFGFCVILVIPVFRSTPAFGCAVCFGNNPDDPAIKGLQYGIFVLLGTIGFIALVLIKSIYSFNQRAKNIQ